MGSTIVRSVIVLFVAVGCTSGQCRRDGVPVKTKEQVQTLSEQELADEVVLIAKTDGSLQCGYKIGIKLDHMASELANIEILKTEKKHDGLMRIQSCGAPTGMMNVFHIHRKNVRKAVKLGYKVLAAKKAI